MCSGAPMRKQYLHLSAYSCDQCDGPVVAGSLAVRENEISKETDIRALGEMCLACGHRQHHAGVANFTRHFLPVEWQPVKAPSRGTSRPASTWTGLHANKPRTISYPFACDRLRLRLCALFFRCLLAILSAVCLLPDCEYPDTGPLIFVSVSGFSCCTSAIR